MGYTGEDYFIYLFQNLLNPENILSILSRNIATVNLFHFIKFENFIVYFEGFEFIPNDKIFALSELAKIYYETSTGYLVTINLLIILFCHFFVKIITVENNE